MRTTWPMALLIACALPGSVNAGTPPDSRDVQKHIDAVISGLLPAVEIDGQSSRSALADRMKALNVPGVSIAVINDGKIEWTRGFGVTKLGGASVTPDTLFQAASISKPIAAASALRLVEEGKLSLDADVNATLKTWKLPPSAFTATTPVTLRALLSHTAGTTVHGFPGYAAGTPLPTVPQILNGAAPANTKPVVVDQAVGAKFRYSGGGYTIAQQLMTDATGQSFPALVREKVLVPAGMTRSTEDQPLDAARLATVAWPYDSKGQEIPGGPHTYPEMAAAGLWTTPTDLARFAIDLREAASGKAGHVLTPQSASLMLTPVKDGYGLGVGTRSAGNDTSFGHGGSNEGYKAVMTLYRGSGDGVVVMTNGDQGGQLGEEIVRAVAAEYGWPDPHPIKRTVAAVEIGQQARFIGTFVIPGAGDFKVRRDGDRLTAEIQDGVWSPLFPDSPTSFFVTDRDLRITFADADHGTVVAGGWKGEFTRKSEPAAP